MSIFGMKFVEDFLAFELVEDWTNCRSLARAQRRHKRGFRQRNSTRKVPAIFVFNGVVHVHPSLLPTLRNSINPLRADLGTKEDCNHA
jgi:hypothetical protein